MSGVLVVRPSSLGDVVYALALVNDIATARPELAIDWVAEEAFAPLVALDPRIRRVLPLAFRRWRHELLRGTTWREFRSLRLELAAQPYAAILDLQEQFKGAVVARMARGQRHGFDRASTREPLATWFDDVHHPVSRKLHFLDRCRTLSAAALGYPLPATPRWGLVPPPLPSSAPAGRYALALHATSRADKLWPEAHWLALLEEFARAGLTTLLPWGNDAERARSERLAAGARAVVVPPRQTLPQLAALAQNAEIVVGVDTGLVHLAAILGTPTLALFTVTDPMLAGVGRVGGHARDLGGNGRVPEVAAALAAVGELWRQSPRC